jgi:hypothetical protein
MRDIRFAVSFLYLSEREREREKEAVRERVRAGERFICGGWDGLT